jgi:hypothetical protein
MGPIGDKKMKYDLENKRQNVTLLLRFVNDTIVNPLNLLNYGYPGKRREF